MSSSQLTIHNRQRAVAFDLAWVRRAAKVALPLCLEKSDDGAFALRDLDEITVLIVSDRAIAKVHRDYMAIPGATDVITFQHGDVVVSAETARARALELGHGTEEELALYIIHALLHLNGFDDIAASAAARMRKLQERLWRSVRAELPPPSPAT